MKNFIEIIDLKTGHKNIQEMHSFVSNYLAVLHNSWGFSQVFRARYINNVLWTNGYAEFLRNCSGGNEVNDKGIVLGTSNTPADTNNYCLGAIVNMLEESTCFVNASKDEDFERITIERYFENTTESAITVKEVGIYCEGEDVNKRLMICRDVLQTPETWEPEDRKLVKIHLGFEDNFNINWQFFNQYLLNGVSGDLKNTLGNWYEDNLYIAKLNAPAGIKNWGILIGSGYTPSTINDYVLENPQSVDWLFSAVTLDSLVIAGDASTTTLQLKRDFTNNTGSTITIRELAIILGVDGGNSSDERIQIARYVFDAIQVANGQILTITWSFATPIATYNPPENPSV